MSSLRTFSLPLVAATLAMTSCKLVTCEDWDGALGEPYAPCHDGAAGDTDSADETLGTPQLGDGGEHELGDALRVVVGEDDESGYFAFGAALAFSGRGADEEGQQLFIGAPFADSARGAVYRLEDLTQAEDRVIRLDTGDLAATGAAEGIWAGVSLDSTYNLRNEGHDQLLVGAPYQLDGVGGAFLQWEVGDAPVPLSEADVALVGDLSGADLGWSVLGLDLDNDGLGELVASAPWASLYEDLTPAVSFFEAPGGALSLADATASLPGYETGDQLGYAMARGDFTADGVEDLAVAAPGATCFGENCGGFVALLFGEDDRYENPGGGADFGEGLLTTRDIAWYGEGGANLGAALAAGDLSGDDQADLVAAETFLGGVWVLSGVDMVARAAEADEGAVGRAYRNYPVSDDAVRLTRDDDADETTRFGAAVSVVGDVSGDGAPDLLIGAPGEREGAGVVYLVYGPVTADLTLSPSLASRSNGFEVWAGESPGDAAGSSLAGTGDLNQDGAPDLAIGAPSFGDEDSGAVYLLFGG